MIEETINFVNGRCQVIAGTGANSTSEALEFFGKNSIYIYVTQAFVLRCIMGVVNRLPFVNMNASSYPYYFIVFILAMLVEIVLILCINKLKHFKKADSDKKILL